MLFNSWEFLIFFPLVTAIYFLLSGTLRKAFLLIASCVFYAFFIPKYLIILFVVILIDYTAGLLIARSPSRSRRKLWLVLSLTSTALVLFFFKYFNFFAINFNEVARAIGWNYSIAALELILPIGLSFHTFQSMSYVIEVYRGAHPAERNLLVYSLYVLFYPQLVAGPIERPQNLLHQLHAEHRFNWVDFREGLCLMLWGLFKKTVIADRLALVVNDVYGKHSQFGGATSALATFFFAYQIYCDFSGYSDIARGSARTMGYHLMINFRTPYRSRSVGEFWRRWHISLSTWFKDYLYVPMGGSQVKPWRQSLNLMITFLVSGLWHGANWTYLIWGGLNGIYLVIEKHLRVSKTNMGPARSLVGWLITFILISVTWVFFRSSSAAEGLAILTEILSGNWTWAKTVTDLTSVSQILNQISLLGSGKYELVFCVTLIVGLEVGNLAFDRFRERNPDHPQIQSKIMVAARGGLALALLLLIYNFGITNEIPFIYFQF